MVDPVGSRPVSPVRGLAPLTKAAPVRPTVSAAGGADEASGSAIAHLARESAASAPVDAARVAQFRRAIADGSFAVRPDAIADRLIALRNDWNGR